MAGGYGRKNTTGTKASTSSTTSTPTSSTPSPVDGLWGETAPEEVEEEEFSLQEEYGNPLAWQDMIYSYLPDVILDYVNDLGEDPRTYGSWLETQMPSVIQYLDNVVTTATRFRTENSPDGGFYQTPEGFNHLFQLGLNWFSGRDSRLRGMTSGRSRGGGGRGGGGARKPTADEIRAQFDVDQLAELASGIWQGSLLETPKNSRDMAKAYVEEIVKNPEQKLDYETWIKKKVEGSDRYASIYRSKPEGMDAAAYIQRYYQTALQYLRPEKAEEVGIMGAQLGADPNAFRGLVNRQEEVQQSTPFISKLEGRMSRMRGVLRG